MSIPIFRGSELDTFQTCHFKFACELLQRCPSKQRKAQRQWLLGYCCPEGADWILANASRKPVRQLNRMTEIGCRFHEFAYAYGLHLKRENKRSDWQAAEQIARGLATVDGEFVPQIYHTARFWYEQFEHEPQPLDASSSGIDLTAGSFEAGHQLIVKRPWGEFVYSFHPDFARLSADLTHLEVWDWKSGMRTATYDAGKPDKQLLRYAWAFSQMYPTVNHVSLYLWFINPKHPLCDEPLLWDFDVDEMEMDETLVSDCVEAIRVMPEFRPSAGCWLCGGFCDWAATCPDLGATEAVMAKGPQDALECWLVREEIGGLNKRNNAKRAALKKRIDAWVSANGPLQVGETDDGEPIMYGLIETLAADVPDMAALILETEAKAPQLLNRFSLEGVAKFAQEAGFKDPFEPGPLETLRVKKRVTRGVTMGGEEVDDSDWLPPEE